MRRRNFQKRVMAWLTPANVEAFYRTVEAHRRQRIDEAKARATQRRVPVERKVPEGVI